MHAAGYAAARTVQVEACEDEHAGASKSDLMEPHGLLKALGGTARSAHKFGVSGCSDIDRRHAILTRA